MKKTMCTLVAVGTALLTTRAAQAETGSNWSGTEVLVSAQTEVSVFRASVAYFGVPKAGTDILFSYSGQSSGLASGGGFLPNSASRRTGRIRLTSSTPRSGGLPATRASRCFSRVTT